MGEGEHGVETEGDVLVVFKEGRREGGEEMGGGGGGGEDGAEGPVAFVDEEALEHPFGALGFEVQVGVFDGLAQEVEGFDSAGGGGGGRAGEVG